MLDLCLDEKYFRWNVLIECVPLPVLLKVNDFNLRNRINWDLLMLFGSSSGLFALCVCVCVYVYVVLAWWYMFIFKC